MKRMKSKAGFTLMEMIVTLLVLVIMTSGVTFSMSAGARIYQESVFESHSALLMDTLNNSLSDILRNSTKAWALEAAEKDAYPGDVNYAFSNPDYGASSAYIYEYYGVLKIFSAGSDGVDLVNTGAYPDLEISDCEIRYIAEQAGNYGGHFTISYRIVSTKNPSLSREVSTVVRTLN